MGLIGNNLVVSSLRTIHWRIFHSSTVIGEIIRNCCGESIGIVVFIKISFVNHSDNLSIIGIIGESELSNVEYFSFSYKNIGIL